MHRDNMSLLRCARHDGGAIFFASMVHILLTTGVEIAGHFERPHQLRVVLQDLLEKQGYAYAYPPPPAALYQLQFCPSYSGRRDHINLVKFAPNLIWYQM